MRIKKQAKKEKLVNEKDKSKKVRWIDNENEEGHESEDDDYIEDSSDEEQKHGSDSEEYYDEEEEEEDEQLKDYDANAETKKVQKFKPADGVKFAMYDEYGLPKDDGFDYN